ncbi:ATP-binding protein [Gordonia rubripertincta]|uniref:ATP-binding protein n=1 Tax=Gordonia rubripertincta TaxID=36822 RepID=UPI0013C2C9E2|nr:ATP-binding protein [Gordonia rubripertincta]
MRRSELQRLLALTSPVVVITGDTGTGKTALLHAYQSAQSRDSTVAPPPVTCTWDGGALQVAVLKALASALSASTVDATMWRHIQIRLENASREMAIETGKSLAKAVAQELSAQVKARLGEHAGEGLTAFVKGLRQDPTADMRRDLKTRSDQNMVKFLARACDEVATALGCELTVAIDECQRLPDNDQRALATLSLEPPTRARFVLAWSSAAHHPRDGLSRLREAGCREVVVGGLDRDGVNDMLARGGVDTTNTDRVLFLSNGFPLIVEGLIGQLRSGGTLDDYTPPTAFVLSLDHALARLTPDAQVAARQLSVFELPPAEEAILGYLAIPATQWGVMRSSLERESSLSINRDGRLWFHQARRAHLWNTILSGAERAEIGEPAYQTLLSQYRTPGADWTGLMVPIARTARYALTSQTNQPLLAEILELDQSQLAVMAALIELETTQGPADMQTKWTLPDPALIYAHNVFGADRGEALDALPALLERDLIETVETTGVENTDPPVAVTLDADPNAESRIVLYGRIQDVLGKTVIPHITDRVVREQYEALRLESTLVITEPGRADAVRLVELANSHPLYRVNLLTGAVCPMMGVQIDYGGHPISLSAIFNTDADRQLAKTGALNIDTESYGRRVRTTRVFEDQSTTVPSWRLLRAVYYATGRQVEATHNGKRWMRNPGPALPIREYARRKADFVDILRNRVSDLEQEIYALDEPRGYAVAHAAADGHSWFVELRGTSRVSVLTAEQLALLQGDHPFRFAQLEHRLALRPGERIHHITRRVQPEGLVDDPVVDLLEDFSAYARTYNRNQPRYRIALEPDQLAQAVRAAHLRDTSLGRTLSEQLTIGNMRGHRPQHALRVAVHPGNRALPAVVAYTEPVGEPTDIQVRFARRSSTPADENQLYTELFGEPLSVLYADTARSAIAGLLGYERGEIELTR